MVSALDSGYTPLRSVFRNDWFGAGVKIWNDYIGAGVKIWNDYIGAEW